MLLLSPSAHKKKEASGEKFIEPLNFSYEKGIDGFLDLLKNNLFEVIDNCTTEEVRHVDPAEYKAAYQTAYGHKKE